MHQYKYYFFIVLFSFLATGCESKFDLEKGIIGSWKCTKVTYEIVKPNWVEANLGSDYLGVIDMHTRTTNGAIFTFKEGNWFNVSGARRFESNWSVVSETNSIDVTLLRKSYNVNNEGKEMAQKVNTSSFEAGLYESLEAMSWEVKEFDAQNKMLVTETLGSRSVIFTYYLECI